MIKWEVFLLDFVGFNFDREREGLTFIITTNMYFNLFFSFLWIELFQGVCGPRPEIFDKKRSPLSSFWGIYASIGFLYFPVCYILKLFLISLTSKRSSPGYEATSSVNLSRATSTPASASGRILNSTYRYIIIKIIRTSFPPLKRENGCENQSMVYFSIGCSWKRAL